VNYDALIVLLKRYIHRFSTNILNTFSDVYVGEEIVMANVVLFPQAGGDLQEFSGSPVVNLSITL
jgi:hypothetical protein